MFKQGLVAVAALALVGVMYAGPSYAQATEHWLCHFDKNTGDTGKVIVVNGDLGVDRESSTGSLGAHLRNHVERPALSGDAWDYHCSNEPQPSGSECPKLGDVLDAAC